MSISKEKQDELSIRMDNLEIYEEDLIEKFILGSGSGGQKLNKTHSCVYLKHLPSGLEIKCQKDRSRATNRFLARKDLCEKIEEIRLGEQSKRRQAIEKIRRQKRRRSKKSKEKMLACKHKHSEKKSLRRSPDKLS